MRSCPDAHEHAHGHHPPSQAQAAPRGAAAPREARAGAAPRSLLLLTDRGGRGRQRPRRSRRGRIGRQEVPLPLRDDDIIRQQADDKELDPSLIAGVIFAESHFRDQTSHAGAKGLMQLMPETADYIAEKSGGTAFVQGDLATPQVNIAYGSWYLRYLLDNYDGREALALAPTTPARARSTRGPPRRAPAASASAPPTTSRSPRRATTCRRCWTRARSTAARTHASWGCDPAHRPLAGRGALVTGVSRRAGIGFAVARRLRELGADVIIQGFVPHDAGQPWGADRAGVHALAGELDGRRVEADFADPAGAAACWRRPPRSRSATSTSWSRTTRCRATRTSRRSKPRRSTRRWP